MTSHSHGHSRRPLVFAEVCEQAIKFRQLPPLKARQRHKAIVRSR
jgi:hypothetical protein